MEVNIRSQKLNYFTQNEWKNKEIIALKIHKFMENKKII